MPAHTARLKPHSLALALAALLPSVAFAAGQDTAHRDRHLTELSSVQVTASPLQGDAESLARPVEVLAGERLDEQKAGTLGDTVAKLPGVQSTFFGPGVGRPIIRGQEGPRVAVLSNGMGNMDASTVSADHATSIEPFLADQIEVLKGPATLLFGSGAIGGAVNVVDGRIARELPERPLSGRAELRGNSVNNERSGMFRLDGVSGNVVLHVDGLVRNGDDYRIPGYAVIDSLEDHHDDHDHDHAGEEGEERVAAASTTVPSAPAPAASAPPGWAKAATLACRPALTAPTTASPTARTCTLMATITAMTTATTMGMKRKAATSTTCASTWCRTASRPRPASTTRPRS